MQILEFLLYFLAIFLTARHAGELLMTVTQDRDYQTPYISLISSALWAVIIVFF